MIRRFARIRALPLCLPLVLFAGLSTTLFAQVRASEHAAVTQTVDGTNITIDYSRPVARGRPALFGGVVRWDQVWTPGANWATTIEVDRDIRLNGQLVPTGKYSMWMIPRAHDDWTLFLSERHRAFHTQKPDPKDAKVTLTVKPEPATHVEVLTWSFPMVSGEGAELRLQWGTTAVPIQVAVESSRSKLTDDRDLRPYTGTYRMRFEPNPAGEPALEMDVQIFEADGVLRGRMSVKPPDGDAEFDLLPDREHAFRMVLYRDGRIFEQDEETLVVFQIANGVAVSIELRFGDQVYGRAVRLK